MRQQISQQYNPQTMNREYEILNSLGVKDYEIEYLFHEKRKLKENIKNF